MPVLWNFQNCVMSLIVGFFSFFVFYDMIILFFLFFPLPIHFITSIEYFYDDRRLECFLLILNWYGSTCIVQVEQCDFILTTQLKNNCVNMHVRYYGLWSVAKWIMHVSTCIRNHGVHEFTVEPCTIRAKLRKSSIVLWFV